MLENLTQAISSRSTCSVGLKDRVSRPHLPRGVQNIAMLGFYTYHAYWDGVVDIYRMYMMDNIWIMKFFLQCDTSNTLLFLFYFFQISIRLGKNWKKKFYKRGFHKMGFHTGIVKKGLLCWYYEKKNYGTFKEFKRYKKGKSFTKCAFPLM